MPVCLQAVQPVEQAAIAERLRAFRNDVSEACLQARLESLSNLGVGAVLEPNQDSFSIMTVTM